MTRRKILQNILTLTTLILLVSLSHAKSSQPSMEGFRIDLRHIDSKGNFSQLELLQRMTRRSQNRVSTLARTSLNFSPLDTNLETNLLAKAKTDAHLGDGEFMMDIGIGTPSLTFPAILDTGSDLIWTQCKPCKRCFSQPTALFDPSTSSTYENVPCAAAMCKELDTFKCGVNNACEYKYPYGDSSSTSGNLATETFTLGSEKAPNITFGCGNDNSDDFVKSSGLVGLGRGPLSLISQLGFTKFSYCLASLDEKKKSPMFFGSLADPSIGAATGPAQSTPLIKNPSNPTYYYLSLTGITVGTTKLDIPSSTFALKSDGTGGTIIDSGTTLSYLETGAYNQVKKAFTSQIQLPVADGSGVSVAKGSETGLDLCFKAPSKGKSVVLPKFILHFDGADLNLPESNYFIRDSTTGLLCLTVMALDSPGISVLGNIQQQNFHIIYDLGKNQVTFVPTQCDKL